MNRSKCYIQSLCAFLCILPVVMLAQSLPAGVTEGELTTILECHGEDWDTELGWTVVALDDINHDGWPDFGVTARKKDEFRVYYGGPGILDCTADLVFLGRDNQVYVDINGDGVKDIITLIKETFYVYFGKTGGVSFDTTSTPVEYPQSRRPAEFGLNMRSGDLNGDGIEDMIINDPSNGPGKIWIYYGPPRGAWIPDDSIVVPYNRGDSWFSDCMAVGDLNGDGVSDIIAGRSRYLAFSGGLQNWNYLYVYYTDPKVPFSQSQRAADLILDSRESPTADSSRVYMHWASLVDMNADGLQDIYYDYPDGGFVHFGSSAGISAQPDRVLSRGGWPYLLTNAYMIGDLNSDGYRDYAIGAGGTAIGLVTYWPGRATGITSRSFGSSTIGTSGHYGENRSGDCLADVGDINGDGYDDVLVAEPWTGDGSHQNGFFHILGGNKNLKVTVDVGSAYAIPSALSIGPVWPNPTHGSSTALVTLPAPSTVRVSVHDLLGRELRVLRTGQLAAGRHPLGWDACDAAGRPVAAGTYLFTVQSNTGTVTTTILVTR